MGGGRTGAKNKTIQNSAELFGVWEGLGTSLYFRIAISCHNLAS